MTLAGYVVPGLFTLSNSVGRRASKKRTLKLYPTEREAKIAIGVSFATSKYYTPAQNRDALERRKQFKPKPVFFED